MLTAICVLSVVVLVLCFIVYGLVKVNAHLSKLLTHAQNEAVVIDIVRELYEKQVALKDKEILELSKDCAEVAQERDNAHVSLKLVLKEEEKQRVS